MNAQKHMTFFYLSCKFIDHCVMKSFDTLIEGLFLDLTDDEKNRLLSLATEKTFKAREIFQTPSESFCTKIWLLKDGAIRMYRENNNKDYTLHLFTHPRFITDYVSVKEQSPATFFMEALIPTTMLEFSFEKLYGLLEYSINYEKVARKIFEELLFEETSRLDDIVFLDATQRYNKLLQKDIEIFQKVPLKHIASYLKISPETLSRIRKSQTIIS